MKISVVRHWALLELGLVIDRVLLATVSISSSYFQRGTAFIFNHSSFALVDRNSGTISESASLVAETLHGVAVDQGHDPGLKATLILGADMIYLHGIVGSSESGARMAILETLCSEWVPHVGTRREFMEEFQKQYELWMPQHVHRDRVWKFMCHKQVEYICSPEQMANPTVVISKADFAT